MSAASSPTPSRRIARPAERDRRAVMRDFIEEHADDLTIAQGAILWAVFSFTTDNWRTLYPTSYRQIARVTPTTRNVAEENIRKLQEKGFIRMDSKPGGQSFLYITDPVTGGTPSNGVPTKKVSVPTPRDGVGGTPADGVHKNQEEPIEETEVRAHEEKRRVVVRKRRIKTSSSEPLTNETRDRPRETGYPTRRGRSDEELFKILDLMQEDGYTSPKKLEEEVPELDRKTSIAVWQRWSETKLEEESQGL